MRRGNEDAFLVDVEHGVFVVADGMGGHVAGEVASALAAEAVGSTLAEGVRQGLDADALARAMARSVMAAGRAIEAHVQHDPSTAGMGTTLTACVLCPDGTYRLANVGDSRAYRWRDGVLEQVTRDHTWVQREVDAGRVRPESAREHPLSHIVTRALGAGADAEPDLFSGSLRPRDLLLLTTDGLTNMIPDEELATLLSESAPLPGIVAEMIRIANDRGGPDNVTAVLVRILSPAS